MAPLPRLNTLGSLLAVAAIFVWLFISRRFYKKYQETHSQQTLFFSLALVSGGSAILFLAAEQVFLTIFDNNSPFGGRYIPTVGAEWVPDVAWVFAVLALSLSAAALFFFVLFSLVFFRPGLLKISILPGLVLVVYVFLFIAMPHHWEVTDAGGDYDVARDSQDEQTLFLLYIGPTLFPLVLFILTTIQLRSAETLHFRTSLSMSLAQALLTFGYTVEILGPDFIGAFVGGVVLADIVVVIGRAIFFWYPLHVYYSLNPTERVKRLLSG